MYRAGVCFTCHEQEAMIKLQETAIHSAIPFMNMATIADESTRLEIYSPEKNAII
jgi:hypothetical protein